MEVLLITLLMTKHVIADYFMQYGWMIKDKATYGAWGGLAHAKLHGIFTFWVLFLCGIPTMFSFALAVFDSVVHYHVDYTKSNVWKNKKLGPADQQYWMIHGLDQFAHFLTYVAIVVMCTM